MEMSYPYIGRHIADPELVVVFTGPGTGVCIRTDSRHLNRLNHVMYDWVEPNFEQYDWTRDRHLRPDEKNYFHHRAHSYGIIPSEI